MVEIFEEIQSWYAASIKPHENKKIIGEFAQFLTQYLDQVESLLQLISCCRSSNWEGYLSSLENIIKYFFARDLLTTLDWCQYILLKWMPLKRMTQRRGIH